MNWEGVRNGCFYMFFAGAIFIAGKPNWFDYLAPGAVGTLLLWSLVFLFYWVRSILPGHDRGKL